MEDFARVRLGAKDTMLAQPARSPWQGQHFTGSIDLSVDNVDELWESVGRQNLWESSWKAGIVSASCEAAWRSP
jgi:hypothetical protein